MCSTSDGPSAELDQLELPVLCDGLRRYLQDLPLPVVPPAVYPQMVHTAKGETPLAEQTFVALARNRTRCASHRKPKRRHQHPLALADVVFQFFFQSFVPFFLHPLQVLADFWHLTLFCHAAFFCCHQARNRISVVNRSSRKAELLSVASCGSQSLASVPYAHSQPHTRCGFAELTEHDVFFFHC